jgi:WD40 repeat protein
LSGSHDSTIKLWCVATGQLLRTLEGHTQERYSCAFSPSGLAIVSASSDGTLRLWILSKGQQHIFGIDPPMQRVRPPFLQMANLFWAAT